MIELHKFTSFNIKLCWSGKVHRLDLHSSVRQLQLLRRDGSCQGLDGQGHWGPGGPRGGQVDLRPVRVQPGLQQRLDQLGRQDAGLRGHDVRAHRRVKALRPAEDLVRTYLTIEIWDLTIIFFLSSNHISAHIWDQWLGVMERLMGHRTRPKEKYSSTNGAAWGDSFN